MASSGFLFKKSSSHIFLALPSRHVSQMFQPPPTLKVTSFVGGPDLFQISPAKKLTPPPKKDCKKEDMKLELLVFIEEGEIGTCH